MVDHYTYRVSWSLEDGEYVATCLEFPSLSCLDSDQLEALRGIRALVADTAADMQANGEVVPDALADRKFSGVMSLRIPPELHRKLAFEAAEAGISLSRHLNHKLSQSD